LGIKDKLNSGQTTFGTFVKINSPAVIEIIGRAGFDFAVIDCEHSPFTFADVENMTRAGEAASLDIVVRVPGSQEEHILHALDAGAAGVQVPGLTTIEEIERVVSKAKYFPEGSRGLSFAIRAAHYGLMDKKSYMRLANERTLIVIHVESRDILDQLEGICDLPQVDVIFIGPVDLSQSLGKPGETKDKVVRSAIEHIFDVCVRKNKVVGIFAGSAEEVAEYRKMGARYIVCSTDVSMFIRGVKETTQSFRKDIS
jgi:4-hydroxy-2-oxoheptanedioate aldolase